MGGKKNVALVTKELRGLLIVLSNQYCTRMSAPNVCLEPEVRNLWGAQSYRTREQYCTLEKRAGVYRRDARSTGPHTREEKKTATC